MRGKLRTAIITAVACVAVLGPTVGTASADPAPKPAAKNPTYSVPVLKGFSPVDPALYKSTDIRNGGWSFFHTESGVYCGLSAPGMVQCGIVPKTARWLAQGVGISGGNDGPYWINFWDTMRNRPVGFHAPLLRAGEILTLSDDFHTSCAAVKRDELACVTANRAFIVTPKWHKFFFPIGSANHEQNPPNSQLPPQWRKPVAKSHR